MISDDMLEVDEYKFQHFPAKWPDQLENVFDPDKTIHDITLDIAQTREIAHYYYHHRKQRKADSLKLESHKFWANYFGLVHACRGKRDNLLRGLSSRTCKLAAGQTSEHPERICTFCSEPAHWNRPKILVRESRAPLPPHVEDLNGSSGVSTTAEAVVAQQSDDESGRKASERLNSISSSLR